MGKVAGAGDYVTQLANLVSFGEQTLIGYIHELLAIKIHIKQRSTFDLFMQQRKSVDAPIIMSLTPLGHVLGGV